MFENIENIKLSSVFKGKPVSKTKPYVRKLNGFTFALSGEMTYMFSTGNITVKAGQVIFVPCGEVYTRATSDDCAYMSIRFHADIENPHPVLCNVDGLPDTDYIKSHFFDLWNMGSKADRYRCYSLFYHFLAHIANTESQSYSQKKKYELILPATDYLKEHIFDVSLKTENLHLLCGISDTYFRKIFISKYGTSPQKYIISKRLSQAETIISSRNFGSIADVALAVGYSDPLYFSKSFAKKFGMPPSEY